MPFQESTRSKHYVAMDFTGKVGRIVDHKDIKGFTAGGNGYAYFRRKVSPKEVRILIWLGFNNRTDNNEWQCYSYA